MRGPMRHSQLKAFHYVALHGGFSRAAEALHLTQPAVSEQVRNLEQDHDLLLFSRERKRVALTETGAHLFRLPKQYFETEQQIAEFLSERRSAIEGELRIIADSAHHVTDILSRFRRRYPDVTIGLRTGNTQEILDELRAYNADIGVVGSLTPLKDIDALDLGSSPIIAFALKGLLGTHAARMTIAELGAHPLVFREPGSKTRQQILEGAAKSGVRLRPAIVAEGREAVREIVLSGGGVGFVSRAEYSRDDRLEEIEIADLDIRMSEAVVHLTQRRDVRLIRAFMEFARNGC